MSAIKCYINSLVMANVRPFSLNTETRLLLNNAYYYILFLFKKIQIKQRKKKDKQKEKTNKQTT